MRIESKAMNPARAIGLLILLGGVALLPVGWMYIRWMMALSIIAISVGLILLMAARDREIEDAVSSATPAEQSAQARSGLEEDRKTVSRL